MNRSRLLTLVVILGLLVLAPAAGSAPAAPAGGTPSLVSYQGHVLVDGAPYAGAGYFKFAVIDGQDPPKTWWSNDGTSSAGSEPVDPVELAVANGLFSVLLGDTSLPGMMQPLLPGAFVDPETYLRVWFSSSVKTDSFIQLADRRIAAVPYALRAEEAGYAAAAGDADTLDGLHAGVFQQHYANVVVVAKTGGDFTTISAALTYIATYGSPSADTPYLVWVAPGVYNEQVTMVPYVDIEGAGELVTRIKWSGAYDNTATSGTLLGTANVELRHLTVENTGGDLYAIAINNWGNSPRLTHVTATAWGGNSYAIGVQNETAYTEMKSVTAYATASGTSYAVKNTNGSPVMTDVAAHAWGGAFSYGVYNDHASPVMTGVTAFGESASATAYGVYNDHASPAMTDVTATASSGDYNRAVSNTNSSPTMNHVIAVATCSACAATYGVYNQSGSSTIQNSTVSATGGSTSYGIYSFESGEPLTVTVSNCQVSASGSTIGSYPGSATRVGASLLAGNPVNYSNGSVICAGVYDENYAFYNNTCP